MSNETAIATIETVKNKLKKYTALKEDAKVKEYLRKLHNVSVTSSLIQETKIDILVRQLASNKTANYNSSARKLLKKWYHKKLLSKPTTTDTNKTNVEQKSDELSESQSFDDNKKRKVLSLAQYLENKKHIISSPSTINTRQKKLTDTQIEVINAQFKAATEKLTASTSDLANTVDKNLIQTDKISENTKKTIIEQRKPKPKLNDLWAEDDDDDDDDNNINIQSQIIESRTVNSNDNVHIQKVR